MNHTGRFLFGFGLVLLLALILASCGGPEEGTVFEKKYEPEHTYTTFIPVQTGSISCGNGCSTPIFTQIPMVITDGEDWKLHIRAEDGETGWVFVDETAFHKFENGDYYSKDDPGGPSDPSYQQKEKDCNDC